MDNEGVLELPTQPSSAPKLSSDRLKLEDEHVLEWQQTVGSKGHFALNSRAL